MQISVESFYLLDADDQLSVRSHLQICGDCNLSPSFFEKNSRSEWIVKANDLCLEIRTDLERHGRGIRKGLELHFDREDESSRYLHTLRSEIKPDTWLFQEIHEASSVDAPPDRLFLILSSRFLGGRLKRLKHNQSAHYQASHGNGNDSLAVLWGSLIVEARSSTLSSPSKCEFRYPTPG